MKKALFFFIMFLMIQVVASVVLTVIGKAMGLADNSLSIIIATSSVASLIIIVLFAWLKWTPVNRTYIRMRPWAVLCWAAIAALGVILPSMGLQDIMPEMPNLAETELEGLLKSRWGYFALGLAAPVAEEFVFRGAILRTLLSTFNGRHWTAIAASAVLFAIAHMNPAQMPHAFLMGLLLGWMYYRTGSIIPGIVVHWVNNSTAYVLSNLMPNAEHLSDIFGPNPLRLTFAMICSLCILLPALFQLHQNMKRAKQDS